MDHGFFFCFILSSSTQTLILRTHVPARSAFFWQHLRQSKSKWRQMSCFGSETRRRMKASSQSTCLFWDEAGCPHGSVSTAYSRRPPNLIQHPEHNREIDSLSTFILNLCCMQKKGNRGCEGALIMSLTYTSIILWTDPGYLKWEIFCSIFLVGGHIHI